MQGQRKLLLVLQSDDELWKLRRAAAAGLLMARESGDDTRQWEVALDDLVDEIEIRRSET